MCLCTQPFCLYFWLVGGKRKDRWNISIQLIFYIKKYNNIPIKIGLLSWITGMCFFLQMVRSIHFLRRKQAFPVISQRSRVHSIDRTIIRANHKAHDVCSSLNKVTLKFSMRFFCIIHIFRFCNAYKQPALSIRDLLSIEK